MSDPEKRKQLLEARIAVALFLLEDAHLIADCILTIEQVHQQHDQRRDHGQANQGEK